LTLVLLHPLGADRRVWDPVLPHLDGDVLALDLPGFGEAPPLGGASVTPRELAVALRDRLPGAFDVAGISLGGWVALELARAGWARSVTAIAPAGLWEQPLAPKRSTARLAARAFGPALPALLRRPAGRRAALLGTVAHPERVPFDAALRLVRAYADAPGFEAANRGMRANRFTGLDDITVPLTLAWCEHDRLVSRPRHVPAHAREFRLRDCGHLPTWDDPAAVARVVRHLPPA
jgi:pimeloyl-ACP methyl ester carboxylesterase